MTKDLNGTLQAQIEALYRAESRRVLATLIRLLGDFDLAEETLHDAFTVAVAQWPRDGVPANPRAWLVSTGRFKAVDALRRHGERLLHRLLGEIEVAEEANERCEHPAGLGAKGCFYRTHPLAPASCSRCAVSAEKSTTGRISIEPCRAEGMREATWMASFRSVASIR